MIRAKISFPVLVLLLLSCSEQPNGGAYEESAPPTTPLMPQVNLCDQQISTWNISLQSYNQSKINHDNICFQLNAQQTSINNEFSSIQAEWPIATSYLRDCYRNPNVANKSTCLSAVCLVSSFTGSGSCNDLINHIRQQFNTQEQIIAQANEQKCSIVSRSAILDMENLSYTIPTYEYPAPPKAPSCATSTGFGEMK